jgi:hypothetical protein
MARISSYPRDKEVQDEDSWIGTESSNRITRNFSAKAIAEYLNINGKISISSQMVFQLHQGNVSDGQFNGVFTGNPFSAASSLVISYKDTSTQEVVAFLDYLVGSEILISEQKEISNFGHYEITSYTLIPLTTTYTLNLTYIGGNGAFENLKYYDFATFNKSDSVGDKNFVFTQATPSAVWTVQHNLDKFPSVTSVNNNNIQAYGAVEYIDKNNLTITFSGGFSGKAYMN